MAKIQVILLEDVAGQGRKGEIVTVSDGYARNFLFNNKKGVLATPEELQKIENRKKKEAKKQEEERNKSLELKNYRNYDELSMNFASGTNLLYGDNAQGKTNILESIYLSATTKSHRGNKDRELIKFEENEAHIRIHFEKQGIDHQLDMHLKK